MGLIVFVGPTLRHAEVAALVPDATVLPPARQGDVFRAVRAHRPDAIVLIDGAFLETPSVWHREILWALDQGVAVTGAASMGALRAAELHPFGMLGVGAAFEAYRDGVLPGWSEPFEDDDEVAIVHAPAELGFRPLSDAMIDLRAMLVRAERAGLVDPEAREAMAGAMKRLHFPRRTLDGLARLAADPALAAWLRTEHRSLKAEDARLALAARPVTPLPFRRERALVWERFVAAAESGVGSEALTQLRQDPIGWRAVFLEALGRQAVAADPTGAGDLGRFRTERGLWTREALMAWLDTHEMDAKGLQRLLQEEAAIDALAQDPAPAVQRAMLDVLRLRAGRSGAPAS